MHVQSLAWLKNENIEIGELLSTFYSMKQNISLIISNVEIEDEYTYCLVNVSILKWKTYQFLPLNKKISIISIIQTFLHRLPYKNAHAFIVYNL